MKDNKNTNTVSSELGEGDLDQVSGGFGGENKPCPDCGSKKSAIFLFEKKKLVCPDCGHVYLSISADPFAR